MSENFIFTFKGITGLPGTAMVLPLLKHIENNRQWSTIELSKILIEEKRIDEDESLDLIEMMTKIVFSDVKYIVTKIRFGGMVLEIIFDSLQHLNEDLGSGFLENNTKFCLAQLYSLSKSINKSVKLLKEESERLKGSE